MKRLKSVLFSSTMGKKASDLSEVNEQREEEAHSIEHTGQAGLASGFPHLKALNTDQLVDKNYKKTEERNVRPVIFHIPRDRYSRWLGYGCAGASEWERGLGEV